MLPPEPPVPAIDPRLIAQLIAALRAQPTLGGSQPLQLTHPLLGAAQPSVPLSAAGAFGALPPAPLPPQGQALAPQEGPLGVNAQLGWGSAPPFQNPQPRPRPRPRPQLRKIPQQVPTRRGVGDFPAIGRAFHGGRTGVPFRPGLHPGPGPNRPPTLAPGFYDGIDRRGRLVGFRTGGGPRMIPRMISLEIRSNGGHAINQPVPPELLTRLRRARRPRVRYA